MTSVVGIGSWKWSKREKKKGVCMNKRAKEAVKENKDSNSNRDQNEESHSSTH